MNKNQWLPFAWSALLVLILVTFFSLTRYGPEYVGKSFVESGEVQHQLDTFYAQIGPAVLNRIDFEEAKQRIIVTPAEIEEHRTRYGSLSLQVESIQDQYKDRIEDAKANGNEQLEEVLRKERDMKIADIQKNFEDDAYVESKILEEKKNALAQYLLDVSNSFYDQMSLPISYEFKDTETGEVFQSGEIKVPSAYKKVFNAANGLFKAKSVRVNGNEVYVSSRQYENAASEYFNGNINLENPVKMFEGTVVIAKEAIQSGSLHRDQKQFNSVKYSLWIGMLVSLLAIGLIFTKFKFNEEWVTKNRMYHWYDGLRIDTKAALLIVTLIITSEILRSSGLGGIYYYSYFNIFRLGGGIIEWGILIFAVWFTIFQLVALVNRLREPTDLKKDIENSYTIRFLRSFQNMYLKASIGHQTIFLLTGFFLAGFGLAVVFVAPYLLTVYAPAFLFLGLPALYILVRRSAYLSRIIHSTEAMAEGRLHEEIAVEGKSAFAQHARNLNNLREGVRLSLNKQAKSERLKTELITNVSHDLRTPLTSIITYTDLLKNEELSAEERRKYVGILDKKSHRLKTLIEDLFEVSKMASGNLELHQQRVDLVQLLHQALGEHEQEIAEAGLDIRVNTDEPPILANVDGQRWWRVLDNLIVNAIKYSMPGTRVYVNLQKKEDFAEFVVKNVTKYELDENVDELFERFKRADTSRHTDGSGLGLAIAQSIVNMHGGQMKIEIDGDLFKVTVTVPIIS